MPSIDLGDQDSKWSVFVRLPQVARRNTEGLRHSNVILNGPWAFCYLGGRMELVHVDIDRRVGGESLLKQENICKQS